jgi:hypothetical protein
MEVDLSNAVHGELRVEIPEDSSGPRREAQRLGSLKGPIAHSEPAEDAMGIRKWNDEDGDAPAADGCRTFT